MSLTLAAQRGKPAGFWLGDDASPLLDYSGFNRTATISGTPPTHPPLVKGATYAPVLSSANIAQFSSPVFKQGKEKDSFTLIATLKVIDSGTGFGEQQVLGNQNQMDGIVVNGTTIHFVTKYATASESRCTYDMQHSGTARVVAMHTSEKNSLFVNGLLVDEVTLSEEQKASTFVTTSSDLYSGATTSSQQVAVNAVGIYQGTLTAPEIAAMEAEAVPVSKDEAIVTANSGDYLAPIIPNSEVTIDHWWDTAEEWAGGSLLNATIVENRVTPQSDESGTLDSYWQDVFELSAAPVNPIYTVVTDWVGEGVVIDFSLDGNTWETATRGGRLSLATNLDPTDKVLQVRAYFAAGQAADFPYLERLNIVCINTNTSNVLAGRTIQYNDAHPRRRKEHIDFHDGWGAKVSSGGSLVISADALEATPARTLEVYIKRKGTNPTFSMTGTMYQNGAANSAALPTGRWTLVHIVAGSDVSGSVTITGESEVGYIGIYDTALSASTIAQIYAAQSGTNIATAGDASVLSISELANAATIYAHDWAIVGAG